MGGLKLRNKQDYLSSCVTIVHSVIKKININLTSPESSKPAFSIQHLVTISTVGEPRWLALQQSSTFSLHLDLHQVSWGRDQLR